MQNALNQLAVFHQVNVPGSFVAVQQLSNLNIHFELILQFA